MSRSTVGLMAFFGVVFLAMGGMMFAGRPRHPHADTPAASSAPETQAPPTGRAAQIAAARASAGQQMSDMADGAALRAPPPGYRSTNARNMIRMHLHELQVAEENYYQEANSYTADISRLMLQRRTGDVTVIHVTYAGPAAWSAVGTHPALPGKSCVIYAGATSVLPVIPTTATDHTQPLGERDLVCDKTQ